MASESGTTGIEPLHFGGTNSTGSAGGRGPSRTPFPIAEQAPRPRSGCVRLGGTKPPRRFWRNAMEDKEILSMGPHCCVRPSAHAILAKRNTPKK